MNFEVPLPNSTEIKNLFEVLGTTGSSMVVARGGGLELGLGGGFSCCSKRMFRMLSVHQPAEIDYMI